MDSSKQLIDLTFARLKAEDCFFENDPPDLKGAILNCIIYHNLNGIVPNPLKVFATLNKWITSFKRGEKHKDHPKIIGLETIKLGFLLLKKTGQIARINPNNKQD